jgi:Fe-S-cluster containining protein
MKHTLSHRADLDDTQTWHKFRKGMCEDCDACCCMMPVEVRLADLIRMKLVDEFEAGEPLKQVAKRLQQARVVDQFNHASGVFVLARRANGDCLYLTPDTRRCTIYEQRPQTCRNHPQKGPRPGFCAYRPKRVITPLAD